MEKYGVREKQKPSSNEKQASTPVTHCPVCNKVLKVAGPVLLCPEHGSAPFEK